MALGKPIVQFDLTEGKYSAQKASLYAKPNDAEDMAKKIIELLEDPERRKKMGEYGRNRVINELSWEHTSKAFLKVMTDISKESDMRRNDKTNRLIKWMVIASDFVLLNAILYAFSKEDGALKTWEWSQLRTFFIVCNMALLVSEWIFPTIIHERIVSAGDVLRKIVVVTMSQTAIAYVAMRHLMYWKASGMVLLEIGTVLFVSLVVLRLIERSVIKRMRRLGYNTRTVVFVGSDTEIRKVYKQLLGDPTTGYRMQGYYAEEELKDGRIPWLGKVEDLLKDSEQVALADEMYVCMSRMEGKTIRALSDLCDREVTKFYYVPISVESIGLNFKREYINDIEIFTTHESPLENSVNKVVKRVFDIVVSVIALAVTALLFPVIYVIIKIQSPGPLFFKQLRTGLDGKNFTCYKFRSMHVNKDADRLQATKDDPRKYPFGNFMRIFYHFFFFFRILCYFNNFIFIIKRSFIFF